MTRLTPSSRTRCLVNLKSVTETNERSRARERERDRAREGDEHMRCKKQTTTNDGYMNRLKKDRATRYE
jgi:hypothetical protein